MLDEHSGHGGSYRLDPETGVRTLIERTLPPQPSQESSDGTATAQTPNRDRNGVELRLRRQPGRRRQPPEIGPRQLSRPIVAVIIGDVNFEFPFLLRDPF